jgi:hypothetical protein
MKYFDSNRGKSVCCKLTLILRGRKYQGRIRLHRFVQPRNSLYSTLRSLLLDRNTFTQRELKEQRCRSRIPSQHSCLLIPRWPGATGNAPCPAALRPQEPRTTTTAPAIRAFAMIESL